MHWRGIEPLCPVWQEELYYSTTNAIKDGQRFLESSHQRKKKGNVGALNFGGAMDHFLWEYRSVVELSLIHI